MISNASRDDEERRRRLSETLRNTPLPDREALLNLGLFLERPVLSRILYMDFLYRKVLEIPGVVMEFGVRWGQNLALFCNLRGIYEPFNYNRKIIGFDTFSGFPQVDAEDGSLVTTGDYGVSEDYDRYLDNLLSLHEQGSPVAHKKKYELVVGDAIETLPRYLDAHPETVVALAYFDFDLYRPTKTCLEMVLSRVVRGSVLAFDEFNAPEFPGETRAVMESMGLRRHAFRRTPLNPLCSYVVVD